MGNLKCFFCLVFLFYNILKFDSQNLTTKPEITIDLGVKSKKLESVSGFLHFNELETLKSNISELKPKFWRFGAKLKENTPKRKQQVNILLKNNIIPILVLSDIYDEEHWYKERGGWIRPSDNPKPFTALVKNLYKELGYKVVFDVWNEPNLKEVWGGTREEYFKTFKAAHDALRSSVGGEKALITGPSISAYDKEYLDSFLKYCYENNIRLDILNWHDLGTQTDAVKLQNHVQEARELLKKYPNLGVNKIYIPEIVGLKEQFNPLTVFTYLYFLEKSNASGGCKACWDNPDIAGENSCWNNSMDGIFNSEGNPRASWWVYKFYANSLDKRLSSNASQKNLISVSYLNSNNDLCLIVGNLNDATNYNLNVKIKNIINPNSFRGKSLKLYKIPDIGSEYLEKPVFVSEYTLLKKNIINVNLKDLRSKTFYYITISK